MGSAKQRPAEPPSATPEAVRDAFEALTPIELARLAKYARWRLRGLGSRQLGRDSDEFVTDALISLLDGRRTWHPQKISFYVCFKGVIKSQTYNLRTKGPADAFDELKSLHKKSDSDTTDPLDRRASRTFQDPERDHEWNEVERLIKERFADDDEAALMLEARTYLINVRARFLEPSRCRFPGDSASRVRPRHAHAICEMTSRLQGKKPEEIREALALNQQQYETILKRVRRAITKILEGNQS